MSYILLSFLAAFFFALSFIFNKYVSKHKIDDKNTLTFYFLVSLITFALFMLPFSTKGLPQTNILPTIMFSGLFFIVGYYLFFIGIKTVDASTFAPIFQVQSVLIAFLSFIFLGERFPTSNYFYLALMIIGTVFTAIDEKSGLGSFFKKGVLIILCTQFLHATSNIFTGFALKNLGTVDFLVWQYLCVGALIIPFYFIFKPKINYPAKSILPFIFANYVSSIGALFLLLAFKQNLTLSSSIALMSSPIVFAITVIISRFNPKLLENHTAKIYLFRAIGILIILFGIFQLN